MRLSVSLAFQDGLRNPPFFSRSMDVSNVAWVIARSCAACEREIVPPWAEI
jgi:hypothetical protein